MTPAETCQKPRGALLSGVSRLPDLAEGFPFLNPDVAGAFKDVIAEDTPLQANRRGHENETLLSSCRAESKMGIGRTAATA